MATHVSVFTVALHELAARNAAGLNAVARGFVSDALCEVAAEIAFINDWSKAKFAKLAVEVHDECDRLTVEGGEIGPPLGSNPSDAFTRFRVQEQAKAAIGRLVDENDGGNVPSILWGLLWGAIMLDFRGMQLSADRAVVFFEGMEKKHSEG